MVMVTHDHDLAEHYADQIVSLVDGRVAGRPKREPNGSGQELVAGLASLIRQMTRAIRSQPRLTGLLSATCSTR